MRKHDTHLAFIIALFAIFSAGCAVTPTTPPDIATPVTAEAPAIPPAKINSWIVTIQTPEPTPEPFGFGMQRETKKMFLRKQKKSINVFGTI